MANIYDDEEEEVIEDEDDVITKPPLSGDISDNDYRSPINKIILGGKTLIDLTQDTVTPEVLLEGYFAHAADGSRIEGTMQQGGGNTCWKYFNENLTTTTKTFRCGFRPLKVMGILKVGDTTYFSMAINDNGTIRGTRYGSAQATGQSGINIDITDNGFTASSYSANYNGNVEFIAIGEQEQPVGSVQFSYGNYELTKGTALKKIEFGFKPQVLILNQRSSANYLTASARTFLYNESLSATQYETIVTTTVAKQAFGTNTVLQIYSLDDDGFTQRPHGSNTTYWSYYAVAGIDAMPMLLSEDGEE